MRISSVGRANSRAGVTLIEMMLVTALIALLVGISFPSVSAGLETIRLNAAADSVASFLNAALNRAERRQEAVAIGIAAGRNVVSMQNVSGQLTRSIELPAGVSVAKVQPAGEHFVVLPGGAPPRITVELANRRGQRRTVRVDPITGAPEILRVTE